MSAKVFLIDEYVPRENESGSDDIIDFNPFLWTKYFRVICISSVKCMYIGFSPNLKSLLEIFDELLSFSMI